MRANRRSPASRIVAALCSSAALLWLAASPATAQLPDDQPETVLATYHVQRGQTQEMKRVLAQAWQTYTRLDMVFAEPHVVLEGSENGNPYFVEILTWKNHDIPDHMPPEVRAIWKHMNDLCEKRDNKSPIEDGEMQLLVPANR